MDRLKVFSGSTCVPLTHEICGFLCEWEDGVSVPEPRDRQIIQHMNDCIEVALDVNVRDCNVFVIQTTPAEGRLHDHLFEAAFMAQAAQNADANKVVIVLPHLSYSRSDRKWRGRLSLGAQGCKDLFYDVGKADQMVVFEPHSDQIQLGKRIVSTLPSLPLIAAELGDRGYTAEDTIVVAGDQGYHKKAVRLAESLGLPSGVAFKVRDKESGQVDGNSIIVYGDVEGCRVVLADDEVLTGGTTVEVSKKLLKLGATEIIIAVTHGHFVGDAIENLSEIDELTEVIVTDSVPLAPQKATQLPFTVVPIAEFLAKIIWNISNGGSVSKHLLMPDEEPIDPPEELAP